MATPVSLRRVSMQVALLVVVAFTTLSSAVAQAPAPTVDPNNGNPASIGWYKAHGWLMWLAFGVFLPVGVLVSRYGQYHFKQWFYGHIGLQTTGLVLATIAFSIAINKFNSTNLWDNTHVKLGVAIMILLWLQPLLSLLRPQRGVMFRPYWYVVHWLFGTTMIILAWFNIFKGLDIYVGSWIVGELKALYVLFAVNIAVLSFAYLFLDRWNHILAQSTEKNVVHPNARYPVGTHDTAAEEVKPTGTAMV